MLGKAIAGLTQQVIDVITLVPALAKKVVEFVDSALADKLMVTYAVMEQFFNVISQPLQLPLLVLQEHTTHRLLQDVLAAAVSPQLHLLGLAVALGLALVIVVTFVI
jgi:hypothetical protein